MRSSAFTLSRFELVPAVIGAVLAFAAIAYLGLRAQPVFVSRAVIQFVPMQDQANRISAASSALSALTGGGTDSQIWAEQEVTRALSRAFLTRFVDRHDLMPRLEAANIVTPDKGGNVDEDTVYKELRSHIEFLPRSKSQLYDFTVSTTDRKLSQYIASALLSDYSRDRANYLTRQSAANIAFLRRNLYSERNQDMQRSIADLISEEMQRSLMMKSERRGGIQVIDPPYTPVAPEKIGIFKIVATGSSPALSSFLL